MVIRETRLIDGESGEVVSRRVLEFNVFNEEQGYLFWNRKHFAKTFQDVQFPREMSDADVGRMTRLTKRVWANTNMLAYRSARGVRPMGPDEMGAYLGLRRSQVYAFLRKSIRLGVMARVEVTTEGRMESQYYISPVYFFSSNRIPLNLYLIFRRQLDAVLPDWVKRRFSELEAADRRQTG